MLPDRLRKKYKENPATGCWEFTGTVTKTGYGRAWDGKRSDWAHRVFYQAVVGPIAEGMQIDHLCRNTRCVNPQHLEAVLPIENHRRSTSRAVTIKRHEEQTLCKRGHPLFGDNIKRDRRGHRICLQCQSMHAAAFRARHRKPNRVKHAVITPLGQFESATAAARAFGIAVSVASWKARNKKDGWAYAADVLIDLANSSTTQGKGE